MVNIEQPGSPGSRSPQNGRVGSQVMEFMLPEPEALTPQQQSEYESALEVFNKMVAKCPDNDGSSYERSFRNSDTFDLLNGRTIVLTAKIVKLKNGEYTNELSLKKFNNKEYDSEVRYLIRAMMDNLIKGSKTEQMSAVYVAKNFRNAGIFYDGCEIGTLAADAAHIIFSNRDADRYSSGGDKPKGYTGIGDCRTATTEHAYKVTDEKALEVILNKKDTGGYGKQIVGNTNDPVAVEGDVKYRDNANSLDELNECGWSRLDAMGEFAQTVIAEKAHTTVNGLEGKDQGLLADAFRLYARASVDKNVANMLRIKDADVLKAKAKTLYYNYIGTTIAHQMSPELRTAMAEYLEVEHVTKSQNEAYAGYPPSSVPRGTPGVPVPTTERNQPARQQEDVD